MLEEYRNLNEGIWNRSQTAWQVIAIMIPLAFGALIETIIYRNGLGHVTFANLPVAGFVPIVLLPLIGLPSFNYLVIDHMNREAFGRIHELENILHIEGNHWLFSRIQHDCLYQARRTAFYLFFLFVTGVWIYLLHTGYLAIQRRPSWI
jgi:hypothetical protein